MTKRNLFYFIQFCILLFGVASPFWQATEVFEIFHPLWVIIPGGLFALLFALAFGTLFNFHKSVSKSLKSVVNYWLGGGFILFFTLLVLTLLNLFIGVPYTWIVGGGIMISSILIAYTYHHASFIFVHTVSLESEKITKPYRFIQISDVHIGSNGETEVRRILRYLKPLSYDFMVITGDLIDQEYASHRAVNLFDNIKVPIYYITGNHEYYLRHKSFTDFIDQTNIRDINDMKVSFRELDIYGIDEKSDTGKVLDHLAVDQERYAICLMHTPRGVQLQKADRRGIDLMLCGHTHNGQIFPLTLMVKARYHFLRGIYKLHKMVVHVSQGTGTWGPKMRLGTNNEITLIVIEPKKP